MKKIFFITSVAVLAFASCSKEISKLPESNEIRFNVSLGATKATATSFETGDAISVFAVEYDGETQMPLQIGGNYLNNEKVAYDGSAWASSRTLYWSNKPCDFYALYPYQGDFASVEAHPFSVATNQDGEGFEASDLMYAYVENVSRNAAGVPLVFNHIMSKLIVNIEKGPKFEGAIPDDIVAHIYNTNVDCKVSMVTGSVEKEALGAKKTITMKKNSNIQFEAVLVPQNIEKRTPLVELTMGGIAYLLEYSLSFRAGFVHTLTVTLNTSPDQEQIEISIDPGVDPWK